MIQNDSKTRMPSILTFSGGSGGGGGGIGGSIAATQVAYGTAANTIGGDGSFTYELANEFLTVTKIRTQVVIEVRNETGSTIEAGRAVYISGYSGASGRPLIAYADADDPTKMPSIGIITNQIATGNNGYVAISGQLNGIDTSTFAVGATLYVDNSGNGTLTTTKPTGSSDQIQNVGRVLYSDANGKIQISNIGRTNDVPNYSFATVTDTTANMPNSRYLAAGAGISITDNGAGSTVEIAATGSASGNIVTTFTADETLAIGDVIRIATSADVGFTTGRAIKANGSTTDDADVIGIASSAATQGNSVNVVLAGVTGVTFSSAPAASSNGQRIYLSTTDGTASLTAPSGGSTAVCLLGRLKGADGLTTTPDCVLRIQEPVGP